MSRVLLLLPTDADISHWCTRRLLRRAGLKAEQFSIATLETLRAQSSDPRHALTLRCKAEGVSVVVPMGEDPLYEVLGTSELLRWLHRAVPHSEFGTVVPNFAPSKLLPYRADDADDFEEEDPAGGKRRRRKAKGLRHPPRFTGVAAATLHKALRIAREGLPPAPEIHYLLDPAPHKFREWAEGYFAALNADPYLVLSHDCETAYHLKGQGDEDADLGIEQDKRIIRMSFAYKVDEGVSVPFEGPYLETLHALLKSAGPKVGHNAFAFDIPVLEMNGIEIGGEQHDSQDAWHTLQSDLDKGLEFVSAFYTRLLPWKHTASSTPDLYAAIDAVAALQIFHGVRADLMAAGQWELYKRHCVDLYPVLRKASKRGVMIDLPLREELRQEFRGMLRQLLVDAQGMVPRVNQRFHPYVRKPKDATGEWEEIEVVAKRRVCLACEKPNVNRRHACKVLPGQLWDPAVHLGTKDETQIRHINVAPPADCTLEQLEKWLSKNGFNPGSSSQLISYMKHYRHPVGFNHKTEEESADNKHLKTLVDKYSAKHPIYPQTLEIKLVQKALSQYVEGMVPDEHGLIHTNYHNGPSTGRLASRGPNLQNISRRASNPYAAKTRKMFIARPGHVFVQCDSSSIEAVLVGYFMGDKDFIAVAKRSVHGYVCAKTLGIPFNAENVDLIKTKHKALYDRKKTTVYLSLYGGSWYLLLMTEPKVYVNAANAKQEQKQLFAVVPGLPKWHHQTRVRAQKEANLRDPWGGKHFFFDVVTYKLDDYGKPLINPETGLEVLKGGKDDKRAVAFRPQASAGRFMRDTLLLVGASKWADYMPANVSVHDSVLLEVPIEMAEEAAHFLLDTMTRPIPELDGLRIGAECEIGDTWATMKKYAAWSTLEETPEEERRAA